MLNYSLFLIRNTLSSCKNPISQIPILPTYWYYKFEAATVHSVHLLNLQVVQLGMIQGKGHVPCKTWDLERVCYQASNLTGDDRDKLEDILGEMQRVRQTTAKRLHILQSDRLKILLKGQINQTKIGFHRETERLWTLSNLTAGVGIYLVSVSIHLTSITSTPSQI